MLNNNCHSQRRFCLSDKYTGRPIAMDIRDKENIQSAMKQVCRSAFLSHCITDAHVRQIRVAMRERPADKAKLEEVRGKENLKGRLWVKD